MSYSIIPAKTYTEPSPFFNAFERKGPAVAAKNCIASTVETLQLIILPSGLFFSCSPDCSRLFVSDWGNIGKAVGNDRSDSSKDSAEKAGKAKPGRIHALNTKKFRSDYSMVKGTFHLPDKAEVNNASQHTTYRWKIHWHLPENKRKKIIFLSREYIQLHLPNRSLHPPMKQSTRMLGMLAEMVEILIHPLVSTLMWFTASLASWLSIVKMMLQLLVRSVGESRSLR